MSGNEAAIERLESFKRAIKAYCKASNNAEEAAQQRTFINQNKVAVRQFVIEARSYTTFTISPPPIVGGLVMKNLDPFELIFDAPYHMNVIPPVIDMLDSAIGFFKAPPPQAEPEPHGQEPTLQQEIRANYAFVSMPIDPDMPELADVLDAVKTACADLGIQAERVDESGSSDPITDQIRDSLRRAEFVIVDLTYARLNVYYEAGYADCLGKKPIFIAKEGTRLEFNVKDYPVIYFKNMIELKEGLGSRLQAQAKRS